MKWVEKFKKRILQIVVVSLCIGQFNFVAEIAAKENGLIQIAPTHGEYEPWALEESKPELTDSEEPEVLLKEPEIIPEVPPVERSQEVIEERTQTSRTYRMGDGSYLTEQFFEPIYKEENGGLVEIDDTLMGNKARSKSDNKQFQNKDGLLKVEMDERALTIDDKIKVTYPEADLSHPAIKENAVLYNQISDQQDMQLTVRADKIFQEITYGKRPEEVIFRMFITTDYKVEEIDETLVFKDEKEEIQAVWKAPVLEDSAKHLSLQVTTTLQENEKGYEVIYEGNPAFFDEQTTYPVSLRTSYDARMQIDVDTGYIRSGSPWQTSNYNDLFVGYDTNGLASGLGTASIIGNGRTFVDFAMPDIGKNQLVTAANLILSKKTDFAGWEIPYVNVFDTNGSVDPDTVTWNSQPSDISWVSSHSDMNGTGDKYFDITTIISDMYHGKDTSIMLSSGAEDNDNYIPSVFYSESVGSGDRPRIQIAHRDDYDVNPDIGINTFQAKFRSFTSGYSKFQAISMDGIAKPYGDVKTQLYEKDSDTVTAVDGKKGSFKTGAYFSHPVYQDHPIKGTQTYPFDDANYTTTYFKRDYFPKMDTMYLFKIWPTKGNETGKQVESDNFIFYKVKLGDNLQSIAAHYDTTIERIKKDNNTTEDIVKEGDEIYIRYPKAMPTLSKELYTPPIRIDTYEAKFKYRGPACFGHCFEGDPINTSTGNFYHETTDFTLQDYEELSYKRTYNSVGDNTSIFGDGFNTPFEQYISYDENNNILYFSQDGKILLFPKQGTGYGNIEEHTIQVKDKRISITNTTTNETMNFNVYGMITSMISKEGHQTNINYDDKYNITGIGIGAKQIKFDYYPDRNLVKSIQLPSGDKVQYEYDGHRLVKFINAKGDVEQYLYNDEGKIESITDMSGNEIANNEYDDEGRVLSQKDGKGQETTITYGNDSATITYPDDTTKTYSHQNDYKISAITDEEGETSSFKYKDNRMVSKSDANGTTSYEYNAAGNLTAQKNPDGTTLEYTYDGNQNLLSKKDASGKSESFTYDAQNNPITQTDENGNQTIYEYDNNKRVIKETDVFGVWKSYTYENNQIKTITHSKGLVETFTYDDNGNMIKESDSQGRMTSYVYDKNNRVIKKTNALNESEEYAYDGRGNLTQSVDGRGAITTYTYDPNNNLIKTTLGNISTSKTYDAKNRIVSEKDEQGKITSYVYDGAGNKIQSIDTYGQITTYEYNNQNDLIKTTDPQGNIQQEEYNESHQRIASTDKFGNTTRYSYDNAGQLIETKQPNGKATKTTYNNFKPIEEKDEFGKISTLEYDSYGRVSKKTDASGNITETKYNAYSQVSETITNGKTTTYEYDVYGNAIKTIDPQGVVTTKTYDALNRVVNEIDALNQTITHVYDASGNEIETIDKAGYSKKQVFNMIGQCVKEIDENGNESVFTYNDKSQNVSVYKGSARTDFIYDEHGDVVETKVNDVTVSTTSYDEFGRKISETTPEKTTLYTYDSFDRVIEETNDTTGLTITKEYDEYSNVLKESDSEGRTTVNEYDDYRRLMKTTDAYGRIATKEYDDYNQITKETSVTSEVTQNIYDEQQNLVKKIDANGNETIQTFDEQHRLLTSTYQNNTTTYTYDALGRVIETHTSIDDLSTKTTYDAKDNILEQSDKKGNVTSHTYDGLNQELTTTDARGNVSSKEYDGMGNIIKTIDGNGYETQTKYNAFNMKEIEVDERGFSTTYHYDEKLRLKEITGKFNETIVYEYNASNEVSAITDGNGHTITYEYDVYGNTTKEIDPNGNSKETSYDELNNVIEIKEPYKTTTNTYDAYARLIETSENDRVTLQQEYDEQGRIIQKTEKGISVEYTHDSYGNVLQEISKGNKTIYIFDEQYRISSKVENEEKKTDFTYDENGNETSQSINGQLVKSATYDENGNITETYENGIHKHNIYDAKNQVIEEQYETEEGYETYYTYRLDETGNVIEIKDLYGSITSKTYDANNSVTSETDANGNVTKYAYDSMGNLEKVQNASDQVMSYKFDGNYNIIEKQIGEKTATYSYDQANRKIKENNEYGYEESYTYDAFDNVTSYTKPDKSKIEYAYDEHNQKIKEGNRSFTYDAYGNLIKASENGKHIQFSYDTYGNIISTKDVKGRETKFTYDAYGNQTSILYHDKTKVTYTYNEFHKKDTVKENDQLVAMYSYDKLGNEISNIRNNVVTKTTYDKLGRKTNIETSKGNENISSYAYTYDGTNNITSEIIDGLENTYTYNELNELLETSKYDEEGKIVNTTYGYDIYGNQIERKNNDEVKVYEYDEDNKLTKIKDEDGITHIKYNKNGNINKIFYGDGEKDSFTYDAYDQLEKIEQEDGTTFTYGYDPQGDRINYKKVKDDPLNQNSWYAYLENKEEKRDKIQDIERWSEDSFDTFKQKLDNADIYKCTFDEAYFNTDWYQTDAEQVIDKTTEHSQVLWQEGEGNQIYGNERLYSKGEKAKTTTYVYGLNNSVYATISSINDKEYIQKNNYDDYGQKPGIGNGYGYNGEFRDESELIYLRARYYNPKIARFIQIDSFKGDIESIQSQNRYVYTHNNPYKYTDPSGHDNMDGFHVPNRNNSAVKDAEEERKRATRLRLERERLAKEKNNISLVKEAEEERKAWNMKNVTGVIDSYAEYFRIKAPPPPPPCPEPSWGDNALNSIQTILDWAGLIGGIGDAADVLNAVIYYGRGMMIEAIISVACVVFTFAADAILKPLKWAAKSSADLAQKMLNAIPGVDIVGGLKGALSNAWNYVRSGAWIPQKVKNFVIGLVDGFKSFIDRIFKSVSNDFIKLSKNNIQHIKKHTYIEIKEQLQFLTDEQLISKLKNTTFFNKSWSQEQTIQFVEEAYNMLRKQGKTGLNDYYINGETIRVFIKNDGSFDTAYGLYTLTINDFK